jgi:hypothetical protein
MDGFMPRIIAAIAAVVKRQGAERMNQWISWSESQA